MPASFSYKDSVVPKKHIFQARTTYLLMGSACWQGYPDL
jgi:hypothetical protein